MPVCLAADHAQLGEAGLAEPDPRGLTRTRARPRRHLAVRPQRGHALPVVQVVRLPELDAAVIPAGGEDGPRDVPAHAPHTRPVVVKLPRLPDVKPDENKFLIVST